MPSATAKYVIPYALLADTVASLAQTTQDLASRTDLLLGESGSFTASPAAGTTLNTIIALSRTYPGNAGGSPPGIVVVTVQSTVGSTVTWNYWVTSWTGTGTTVTGFTIGMQWSAAQAGRVFNWRFIPVL